MIPATLQFIIAMVASAINERMQRKLDCVQEEVRVPPSASWPDSSASVTTAKQTRLPRARQTLSNRKSEWLVAAALMSAVIGLSAGCSTSPSTTADAGATGASPSTTADAGASNARAAPSPGGTSGTVDSVSTPTFTLTTAAGQKVTVSETSSTTYQNGTGLTSASAIAAGESVVVLGTVNSTTITATQVTVEANDGGGSAASAAAGVVPFQQGAPSVAQQVGQIPANYTEGEGTIVSGATADQATEAALAAYPGILVDRVVLLSNGEYEVHCIGVNWPHHVFVDQTFTVVGAN
jgi:hypothetical protein